MKLISLVGSLRKDSYNRKIFDFYRTVVSDRAEITEGKFDDFPLYNEDLKEKAIPESVMKLGEQIKNSDGILIFSPEYNYSVPGVLKNAIDWLSRLPAPPFAGKPAAILSASPGKMGGARMQYHLRQIGVFLDIRFLNRPEVMISEVQKKINERGELTDEETKKFIKGHFDKFLKFIESEKVSVSN